MVRTDDVSTSYPRSPEYLQRKVPPKDASIAAPVGAPVSIRWDRWGIAHVRAERPRDLMFGLGYATAQECLWRLDYCRRLARGELAAVLGRDALSSDRTMRLLGLGRHADALAGDLPESVAEALDGLASGINRWIEQAVEACTLPVEFDWLGYTPAPWTPADSIAVWKQRWWMLTGRLENIAIGEAARRHLPPALRAAFMATELGDETIIPDDPGAAGPSAGPAPVVPGGADDGAGSNNWAVAGSRTTTGYPVLCSDPHNPFSQPGQWFQAQLTLAGGSAGGTLDAIGAVYAGSPGVYMGRNRHVAWGFTNHVASVRDLYVEVVSPDRPGLHLDGGAWRPFDVERASIAIRGEAPEDLVIRRTVRGPVVDALLPDLDGAGGVADGRGSGEQAEPAPISLCWAGLEVGSGLDALLALNRAGSARQAIDAMETWVCPVANTVVADDAGHIAYHVVGRVPRRAEAARRYRRANDPADAWQGFIAYADLPQMADPPRGWIATANQPPWKHDPPGLSYLAGAAWADGGRMRRIHRRLTEGDTPGGRTRLSPAELGAIQADVTSERAVELVPALVRVLDNGAGSLSPLVEASLAHLRSWDARFTLDTPAPSIWVAFWEHFQRRVAAAHFPARLVPLVQGQAGAVARDLLLGRDTTPPWFGARNVREEIRAAFADAADWLAGHLGAAPEQWRWGARHTVTWRHALSEHGPPEQRAAAATVFDVGPFPTTGGVGTVRAAGHAGLSAAHPFEVVGGATYRLVADLSPGGTIMATTTTGQSGHPGSPHYADQSRLWLADAYHPFPMDDFDAEGTTRIAPAGG